MQGRAKWSPTIIFANPTALVKYLKISFAITFATSSDTAKRRTLTTWSGILGMNTAGNRSAFS